MGFIAEHEQAAAVSLLPQGYRSFAGRLASTYDDRTFSLYLAEHVQSLIRDALLP
jgi:hypothetical protein